MKCANCYHPALFVYEGSGITAQGYCDTHLPNFLRPLVKSGVIKTTDEYLSSKEAALSKLRPSKKAKKAVEEEPVAVVEETIAEEPVEETVEVVEEQASEETVEV